MAMKVKRNVKAQKQYSCEACGEPIVVGTLYQWAKPFRGPKRTRHQSCPTWKPSELESGALADAYAAQEAAHEALDSILDVLPDAREGGQYSYAQFVSDVTEVLNVTAGEAETVAEQLRESFDNMPEGLQQGGTGQMLEERADAVDAWVEELNSWSASSDEPDDNEDMTVGDWCESILNEARETIDSLEV